MFEQQSTEMVNIVAARPLLQQHFKDVGFTEFTGEATAMDRSTKLADDIFYNDQLVVIMRDSANVIGGQKFTGVTVSERGERGYLTIYLPAFSGETVIEVLQQYREEDRNKVLSSLSTNYGVEGLIERYQHELEHIEDMRSGKQYGKVCFSTMYHQFGYTFTQLSDGTPVEELLLEETPSPAEYGASGLIMEIKAWRYNTTTNSSGAQMASIIYQRIEDALGNTELEDGDKREVLRENLGYWIKATKEGYPEVGREGVTDIAIEWLLEEGL